MKSSGRWLLYDTTTFRLALLSIIWCIMKCSMLICMICAQTSAPLHGPQHLPPTTSARASAAPTRTDALLYPADANQESMYHGR
jgi:hypothetical protein